ncbi:MAG: hypothetical protein ABI210_10415 [Abditibacteriaceae bacterium]
MNQSSPLCVCAFGQIRPDQQSILVLGHHQTIEIDGGQCAAQASTRWGFEFSAVTLGTE